MKWWGRWDLNPGSPAPQAGILDQARLRPLTTRQRPSEGLINTLIKLKSLGKAESTLKAVSYRLSYLSRYCNIDNPDEVAQFIASLKHANSYKDTFVKAYHYYVQLNGLSWKKPIYKWERKIPKIPTTEKINQVIARASRKYATIFRILMETGVMPYELSQTADKDIDLEKGIINIRGYKGHASRSFKLKPETLAMLKWYIQTYSKFPKAEQIGKRWRKFRTKLAETLHDSSFKTIRCYDLRHYYATMTYYRTKDILYTKQQLGHKRIETTLLYAQLVNFESDEYTSAVAKNIQEAQKLIESGFEFVTTFEGLLLFRKRK